MYTENTPQNVALASAVNSRIKADAMMLKAKSAAFHLASVGAMCALICLGGGLGVGAGFFGYSYINDSRTSAEKMAQAFSNALEKATLTREVKLDTNGALVQVDPTSTVKVNPNAPVRLDPQATVKLDPNATVNIRGGVTSEIPRPTQDQLYPKTVSKPNVVTNYNIFKPVKWGKGEVLTGSKFSSNEEASPSE
jgi:hypothetical protein